MPDSVAIHLEDRPSLPTGEIIRSSETNEERIGLEELRSTGDTSRRYPAKNARTRGVRALVLRGSHEEHGTRASRKRSPRKN